MDKKIISTIKKYQPSGKISVLTIPIMLIIGIIIGIFSSWIVSFVMSLLKNKYLLVVYPAFIGLLCGISIRLGIKFGKCRNTTVSTVFVFLISIISYISFLMFQSLNFGTGFELLQYIMVISNKGYIFKYFKIVEIGVWFLWGSELIIVFFMAYFVSRNRAKKPFCENCEKWCNEKQIFIAKSNDLENVLNAIKNENYETLKNLLHKGISKVKSLSDKVIIEMLYCKNCNCTGFMTVSNVTTVGKKIKDELIKTYLLYATIDDKKAIEDLLHL